MSTTDEKHSKFEETYGKARENQAQPQNESTGERLVQRDQSLMAIGRWIFTIMLITGGLIVGGIFALVAFGLAIVVMLFGFVTKLFYTGSGQSISRREP